EAVVAAPGPAPLLSEARDRAREPDRDGGVERADVDAELQRVRRGDAEQVALDQPALDLAALGGRVAGAIGGEAARRLAVDALGGEAVDELSSLPALDEADGSLLALDQVGHQAGSLAERTRPDTEVG